MLFEIERDVVFATVLVGLPQITPLSQRLVRLVLALMATKALLAARQFSNRCRSPNPDSIIPV